MMVIIREDEIELESSEWIINTHYTGGDDFLTHTQY